MGATQSRYQMGHQHPHMAGGPGDVYYSPQVQQHIKNQQDQVFMNSPHYGHHHHHHHNRPHRPHRPHKHHWWNRREMDHERGGGGVYYYYTS